MYMYNTLLYITIVYTICIPPPPPHTHTHTLTHTQHIVIVGSRKSSRAEATIVGATGYSSPRHHWVRANSHSTVCNIFNLKLINKSYII